MSAYKEFEKEVYNWLLKKHNEDPDFNFSTRQNAAKGSELDYFIGTEKSNYFATTFWAIPVSFPGSSMDLINLVFVLKKGIYNCNFQFIQIRNSPDQQNEFALSFIQGLKPLFKEKGIQYWENPPENKMEYFDIKLSSNKKSISDLLGEVDGKLREIIHIIDLHLAEFKKKNIQFTGERIDNYKFDEVFQRKLMERLKKYQKAVIDPEPSSSGETARKSNDVNYDIDLNTILYGPPGTGKTYSTLNKALQIVDPGFYHENANDRESLKQRFSELLFKNFEKESESQIAFCTFHQSLSYEDFIEGIKPETVMSKIEYHIQDGIFKHIAYAARKNYLASQEKNANKEDFDTALRQLIEEWEANRQMEFSMKTKGYEFTITEFTEYSIRFRKASGGEGHTLSLQTLEDAYYERKEIRKTGVGIYYPGILEKLQSYKRTSTSKTETKNYVLIIDEINRGNVSQIFGELITGIEQTKRLGNPNEELEIILPYSKTAFSVPPNLFIIGTMNTADRSVEALDTALRRRFVFEEMIPEPDVIEELFKKEFFQKMLDNSGLGWDDPKWIEIEQNYIQILDHNEYQVFKFEIDLVDPDLSYEQFDVAWKKANLKLLTVQILEKLNERIEILLSRDNLIGHSFFIGVYTLDALRKAIYKNVIPLLQEYFFGDYEKIGLILGEGFVIEKNSESGNKVNFAKFSLDEDPVLKRVYDIKRENRLDFKSAIANLLGS